MRLLIASLLIKSTSATPPLVLTPPAPCLPPRTDGLSDCETIGEEKSLCLGMTMLATASCEELSNQSFIEHVMLQTGLADNVHDGTKLDQVYGPDLAQYTVRGHGKISLGVFQQPEQLSLALMYLSRLHVKSYIELGIFAGWTACIVSSYLRRFARAPEHLEHAITNNNAAPHFRGWALDISMQRISHGSSKLLQANGMQPMLRKHHRFDQRVDLCFIDASHAYKDVLADYQEFAPHCKYAMFHDIHDFNQIVDKNMGGGVARFWADLKANMNRERWVEFVETRAVYPPTLGIGLVLPHADGTARSDLEWGTRRSTAPWGLDQSCSKFRPPATLGQPKLGSGGLKML